MRSKEFRLHHSARMKIKAERISRNYIYSFYSEKNKEQTKRQFRMNADNLKICSCYMCGNPRKYFKEIKKQEKLSKLNFEEQMEEALWNMT